MAMIWLLSASASSPLFSLSAVYRFIAMLCIVKVKATGRPAQKTRPISFSLLRTAGDVEINEMRGKEEEDKGITRGIDRIKEGEEEQEKEERERVAREKRE